jgi:2-oxo-4-hydroxy-4-carboxy-5-ureidoimidazoline decarboxylase
VWDALDGADWLEAFSHHPRIGQKTSEAWANEEQSGTRAASSGVLGELAKGNEEYTNKFGYVFLVCATGKTADEMLALLRARLGNSMDDELKIAAEEQGKITQLRLEKLIRP